MSILQRIQTAALTDYLYHASRWSPEKIKYIQQKRLRKLVRYAGKHSPYFRGKYRGINPERFSLADLPTTHKDELMDHFDQVVTDPQIHKHDLETFTTDPQNLGHWFLDRYAVSHTSGTQGRRALIVQDRRALQIFFALMCSRAHAFGTPGIMEGLRRLRSPARIAVINLQRGFYPSASSFEFMQDFVGRFIRIERFSAMQPDLIDRLNAFQPNVLISYTSVLEILAKSYNLRLHQLCQVANFSEQMSCSARSRIRQSFGVPILDHYGLGECLQLSEGCPTDGGAHINADWAILEVVDKDNHAVPDGQLGHKVLVTNLANYVQPIIRYEVGDQVSMAATPCRCGNCLPRIGHIEGRTADVFEVGEGKDRKFLYSAIFQIPADAIPEVCKWQAVQKDRYHIEIRLETMSHTTTNQAAIRQIYRERLLQSGLPPDISFDIQAVPFLEADPITGKYLRMISHVMDSPSPVRQDPQDAG
jgi:phenylacetate-CoA ligase